MLRSKISRLVSASPLRNRLARQNTKQRSYSSGSYPGDQRMTRQFEREDESKSRPWTGYVIPAAVILFIGGLGTIIKRNDEKRAIPKGSNPSNGLQIKYIEKPAIGGPFQLYDTENKPVTNRDLLGNWTLMYFGYTSSPDVGPEEIQKMTKAAKILESEYNIKVKPVFVTIDPQRDTPDQLRAYLNEFDSNIMGLTGPINAVRQIAHEYRVYFRKVDEEGHDYLIESSNNTYLLDPNTEVVKTFGVEYDASQMVNEIVREVKKASKEPTGDSKINKR